LEFDLQRMRGCVSYRNLSWSKRHASKSIDRRTFFAAGFLVHSTHMKIVNFGSLNIDHVYEVDHFVRPGETIPSRRYRQHCGGKGLNQSIALACAGCTVHHAGKIGSDGQHLLEKLRELNVDVSLIAVAPDPTGHAIIQVSPSGENSIIVEGGANRRIDSADIERVLGHLFAQDWLLLQNELNAIDSILESTRDLPCTVVLNPAPMTKDVAELPLDGVDFLILNETEGADLTGTSEPSSILELLIARYPSTQVVLTLGSRGAVFRDRSGTFSQRGFPVTAIDTTAAGDTFVGYFIASMSRGIDASESLRYACKAASVCVTRSGAADSIPRAHEIFEGAA
jgi:ribokinase